MIAALDNLCTYLSGIVGAPSEQIKLILVMYAIIPLSLINYLITAPFLRLLYSLIFGLFLQFTLYGSGIIHTFISTIITYLFIKFYGRKKSAFYILIITILYYCIINWRGYHIICIRCYSICSLNSSCTTIIKHNNIKCCI